MKQLIVLDLEVYSNYFLASFYNPKSDKTVHYEFFEGQPLNRKAIQTIMRDCTTVSFNGINFDLPLLQYALNGASVLDLKRLCDTIIKSNLPAWRICKDAGIYVPADWDHIDLIEVAPGQSSLKIYGARLNSPTIQDLPIEPDAMIKAEQREPMRSYCENDLRTTWLLYKALEKQIDLRISMSEQYGVDLRSKSDAQIAETVIKSELHRLTGKEYRKPELPDGVGFRYLDPKLSALKQSNCKTFIKRFLILDLSLARTVQLRCPTA